MPPITFIMLVWVCLRLCWVGNSMSYVFNVQPIKWTRALEFCEYFSTLSLSVVGWSFLFVLSTKIWVFICARHSVILGDNECSGDISFGRRCRLHLFRRHRHRPNSTWKCHVNVCRSIARSLLLLAHTSYRSWLSIYNTNIKPKRHGMEGGFTRLHKASRRLFCLLLISSNLIYIYTIQYLIKSTNVNSFIYLYFEGRCLYDTRYWETSSSIQWTQSNLVPWNVSSGIFHCSKSSNRY